MFMQSKPHFTSCFILQSCHVICTFQNGFHRLVTKTNTQAWLDSGQVQCKAQIEAPWEKQSMMCHKLGQHRCLFTARTIGKYATQTISVSHPIKRASVCQSIKDHNLLHNLWHHFTHHPSMMKVWPSSRCMDWTLNHHITSVIPSLKHYSNMPSEGTWRSCIMRQTEIIGTDKFQSIATYRLQMSDISL